MRVHMSVRLRVSELAFQNMSVAEVAAVSRAHFRLKEVLSSDGVCGAIFEKIKEISQTRIRAIPSALYGGAPHDWALNEVRERGRNAAHTFVHPHIHTYVHTYIRTYVHIYTYENIDALMKTLMHS